MTFIIPSKLFYAGIVLLTATIGMLFAILWYARTDSEEEGGDDEGNHTGGSTP
jgi:hypothetical protein